MVNMGSNVHHSCCGKYWWVSRIDSERDVIRQQKRNAWIKGFIVGVISGGIAIYGLMQFWEYIAKLIF